MDRTDPGSGAPAPADNVLPAGMPSAIADRYAYAFGVRAGGLLWVAGQVAMDERGAVIGTGDIEAQAERVFENLGAVLAAAGASYRSVVSTTTYVVDRDHLDAVNRVRRRCFAEPPYPTSTLLVVAGLARPEFLLELEAVAVVGGSPLSPPGRQ